jgi:hypothetical protein
MPKRPVRGDGEKNGEKHNEPILKQDRIPLNSIPIACIKQEHKVKHVHVKRRDEQQQKK